MKVSRTVVREALMLLEEDGLIWARRGVGRFVADTLPRIGIERIRPFEEVLGGPGQHLEIKRVLRERQPASEFVAPGVGVEPGADCWLWESVLIPGSGPRADAVRQTREPALLPGQVPHRGTRRTPVRDAVHPVLTATAFKLRAVHNRLLCMRSRGHVPNRCPCQ
ncbi:GntR family transcriptional regulator [Pseudarthrobacter sp. O4]|uniref:GntR family transcriptional regulator n=1 Tax=Pseudarthrobacter sp. O4 TaxID=3418417 RepID=UPI003CF8B717